MIPSRAELSSSLDHAFKALAFRIFKRMDIQLPLGVKLKLYQNKAQSDSQHVNWQFTVKIINLYVGQFSGFVFSIIFACG